MQLPIAAKPLQILIMIFHSLTVPVKSLEYDFRIFKLFLKEPLMHIFLQAAFIWTKQ